MNALTATSGLMGGMGITAGIGGRRVGLAMGKGERLRYSMISESFSSCNIDGGNEI